MGYALKKQLRTETATISINDDGSGQIDIRKPGWYNSGARDEFLLSIIRIGKSPSFEEFKKALHTSLKSPYAENVDGGPIQKKDIIQAIEHSLSEDSSDGLYGLLGDNARNQQSEDMHDQASNEIYEMQRCFEHNFYDNDVARDIADTVAEHAGRDIPAEAEVFEKEQKHLATNFYHYKRDTSWKTFIFDKIKKCDQEHNLQQSPFFKDTVSDAAGFIGCLIEEIETYRDDAEEGLDEEIRNSFYEKWNPDDKFLKELSEERGIPFEILQHCSHGGYDELEKFRPIKENQTFLESYGAKIFEPSEQQSNK